MTDFEERYETDDEDYRRQVGKCWEIDSISANQKKRYFNLNRL